MHLYYILPTDIPKQVNITKNSWKKGVNAGGSRNDLEKFSTNPQYLLTLTEPDEGDSSRCSILLGLMQEHRRSEKHRHVAMLPIALFIYKVSTKARFA